MSDVCEYDSRMYFQRHNTVLVVFLTDLSLPTAPQTWQNGKDSSAFGEFVRLETFSFQWCVFVFGKLQWKINLINSAAMPAFIGLFTTTN